MDRLWAENDDSRVTGDPSLVVDVAGFEGPLDLLLHLARTQKVDLSRISILALVEQYLTFVETARALRLELAADYLVMAAWLAFLKSKLLIPKQPGDDGESGEELAAVLQFRLKRLEAMRDASARLVNRNRLGRDVFARGMPEMVIVEKRNAYSASLYDLLTAYAQQRQKQAVTNVTIARRGVWSLKDARDILTRMVGALTDWTALDSFLIQYLTSPSVEIARAEATGDPPSLPSAYTSALYAKAPYFKEVKILNGYAQPRPVSPNYLQISVDLQNAFSAVFANISSPASAMSSAASQISSLPASG